MAPAIRRNWRRSRNPIGRTSDTDTTVDAAEKGAPAAAAILNGCLELFTEYGSGALIKARQDRLEQFRIAEPTGQRRGRARGLGRHLPSPV